METKTWKIITVILIVAIAAVGVYAFTGTGSSGTFLNQPLFQKTTHPECTAANNCYCFGRPVNAQNIQTGQTLNNIHPCFFYQNGAPQ